MARRLKPLSEQVVIITGASSGIGLATARLLADRGARVVLNSRSDEALAHLSDEIRAAGGQAAYVAADVADEAQVRQIAATAIERFGGYDTWINDAGISIFGQMTDVAPADHRRLFETNFWGVVNGSLEAARYFRGRGGRTQGAIINVGSVLSDIAIPVQGMYSASKFAVKGFTDALRLELDAANVPAVVTLIKPSAIDTPFTRHARNYMDEEPSLPPPVYKPDVVARAIAYCCEAAEREVTVGGGGRGMTLFGRALPGLSDRVFAATLPRFQRQGIPPKNPEGALHQPNGPELRERGEYGGPVLGSSVYTAAALHPVWAGLIAVGVGVAAAALLAPSQSRA
ncbi:MAG TPA: SDR family oxidoreductase [Gemmataceae bacterium]|nr:SDR family oxidoreductase [Gemmataceae bacterium]